MQSIIRCVICGSVAGFIALVATLCIAAELENPINATKSQKSLVHLVDDQISLETVRTTFEQFKAEPTNDSVNSETIVAFYSNAIVSLEKEQEYRSSIQQMILDREMAPRQIQSLQSQLDRPAVVNSSSADMSIDQAVAMLVTAEKHLASERLELARLESEAGHWRNRRHSIAVEVSRTSMKLEKLQQKIDARDSDTAVHGSSEQTEQACALYDAASSAELQARLDLLHEKLLGLEGNSTKLLDLKRRLTRQRITEGIATVQNLQQVECLLRQREAIEQESAAKTSNDNAAQGVVKYRFDVIARLTDAHATLEMIQLSLSRARMVTRRVSNFTDASIESSKVGLYLRRQRGELPGRHEILQRLMRIEEMRTRMESELLADDLLFSNLGDVPSSFVQIKGHSPLCVSIAESLHSDRESCYRTIVEAEIDAKELQTLVTQCQDDIDRRVVWMRSTDLFGPSRWIEAATGLFSMFEPTHYHSLLGSIHQARFPGLLEWLCIATAVILIGVSIGRHAGWLSLPGILETCAIALVIPSVLAAMGLRLTNGVQEMTLCLGESLLVSAWIFLPVEVARASCRTGGLLESWLGWDPIRTHRVLRVATKWAAAAFPMVVLLGFLKNSSSTQHLHSLSQASFVLLLVIVATSISRVFSAIGHSLKKPSLRGVWMRRLLHAALVAIPVGLVVASVTGFHDTSLGFAARLHSTAVILTLAGFLFGCVVSVFPPQTNTRKTINRVDLCDTVETTKNELNCLELFADRTGDISDPNMVCEDSFVGVRRFAGSLLMFVSAGCVLATWQTMIPGFDELCGMVLWVDPKTNISISVSRMMMAGAALALTWILSRDVASIVEASSQCVRGSNTGAQQAFSSIARYSTYATGICVTAMLLGIGWDRVQWLAAAMTFGLGFGLQEIFANFASGIIMLLERPVRPGDTVTVGGVTGIVTKIKMRATTITDWDCRESVIPNRSFITDKVSNWTLSNRVLRVIVRVGVAYGTDASKVQSLLLEIAQKQSKVLNTPAPQALFNRFGDSTLDFELWCYVASMEDFHTISHHLNMAIDQKFREHKIEVAFPQTDVHIRSIDASLTSTLSSSEVIESTRGGFENRVAA